MLKLLGHMNVDSTAEDVFETLAKDLLIQAKQAIAERGVFHLALSGGSTPEPFYRLLVTHPDYRCLPWKQTHLWVVDERQVAIDHEQSNYRMLHEIIVEHTPILRRNVHPMPVLASDPAGDYEQQLRDVFSMPTGTPQLDVVLLGMGADCHTASLFPSSPALLETQKLIACNDGEKVTPPARVTMTYPLLNAALNRWVLALGSKKHIALKRVAALDEPDIQKVPISGISPSQKGQLCWYLDAHAAGCDSVKTIELA